MADDAKGQATFRRSLIGIAPADATRALRQGEEAFAREQDRLLRDLAAVRADRDRLEQQVNRLADRGELLRRVNLLLAGLMARERDRAPHLAMIEEKTLTRASQEHQAALKRQRLESARVNAELRREQQELDRLVTDLRTAVSERAAIPSRAPRFLQLQTAPSADRLQSLTPAEGPEPGPRAAGHQPEWREFLLHRRLKQQLTTGSGEVLAEGGSRVTPETISAAEEAGVLLELFLAIETGRKPVREGPGEYA